MIMIQTIHVIQILLIVPMYVMAMLLFKLHRMQQLDLQVRYFQDSTPLGVPCREENFVRREIHMSLPLAQTALVLVDMWATWCKNCLTMDKTTMKAPAVESGLADYVKVKLQAEDLGASPAREVLKHLGGIGLPTSAILRPRTEDRSADAPGAARTP